MDDVLEVVAIPIDNSRLACVEAIPWDPRHRRGTLFECV